MASAIVLLVSLVALSLRYPDIRRAAGNAVVAEIRRMSLFVTFTLRERLSEKSLRTLPVRRWSKPPARPVNIGPSTLWWTGRAALHIRFVPELADWKSCLYRPDRFRKECQQNWTIRKRDQHGDDSTL